MRRWQRSVHRALWPVLALAIGFEIGELTNLCAHQNGPIGEGRIIDGCVTVRIRNGIIEVDPKALPAGTPASITCPAMAVSQQS